MLSNQWGTLSGVSVHVFFFPCLWAAGSNSAGCYRLERQEELPQSMFLFSHLFMVLHYTQQCVNGVKDAHGGHCFIVTSFLIRPCLDHLVEGHGLGERNKAGMFTSEMIHHSSLCKLLQPYKAYSIIFEIFLRPLNNIETLLKNLLYTVYYLPCCLIDSLYFFSK